MNSFTFRSDGEADTARLGQVLADCLKPNAVIALSGPLGAGKTRLVQAIAGAAGVDQTSVTSPTFTLVHEYVGRVPIFHVDAYRLRDPDEFDELGLEETFDAGGWTLVEWSDKFPECLPCGRLEVRIEVVSPDCRTLFLQATDPGYAAVIARVAEKLAAWE